MDRQSYGHSSATLPHGITQEANRVHLDALVVVCHGWRKPARERMPSEVVAPGRWLEPLRLRAAPAGRGKVVQLMPETLDFVVLDDGPKPRLKLVLS